MWNDPIVEQVRKVRDEHAKKFNYDLKAIVADLQKQQKASKRKFVMLPPRKPAMLPKARIKKG
jgi:hypothetical protein